MSTTMDAATKEALVLVLESLTINGNPVRVDEVVDYSNEGLVVITTKGRYSNLTFSVSADFKMPSAEAAPKPMKKARQVSAATPRAPRRPVSSPVVSVCETH